MEAKRVIIATESFVVNQGFHLIFNNLRYYQVINKTDNFKDLIKLLNNDITNIVLISSKLLEESGNLNQLIHQERENPFELIAYLSTDDTVLENKNMFSLQIHSTDSKEVIINGLNGIIEPQNKESEEIESAVVSEREKEILKQVALGLTNNEIAERLFISAHTVITHRKKITKKLGIKSVSGLTVYAIINGLVEMEDIGEKV